MAPQTVEILPQATAEAEAARVWYEGWSRDTAMRFMAQLNEAIESIAESPNRWMAYLHKTRCYKLRRFPYLVVYRVMGDRIRVFAIAHASQKPGYWKKRT